MAGTKVCGFCCLDEVNLLLKDINLHMEIDIERYLMKRDADATSRTLKKEKVP